MEPRNFHILTAFCTNKVNTRKYHHIYYSKKKGKKKKIILKIKIQIRALKKIELSADFKFQKLTTIFKF
jgi:hypothetical protein